MTLVKLRSGVTLEIEISGTAGAPLMVLVPGAGAPLDFWHPSYVDALIESGFRVLRFNHRDTGLADHFDEAYSIDVLISEMWELIDRFEAGTVHLTGHSMGSYMGVISMLDKRHRLSSVTAISAGPTTDQSRYSELRMIPPDPSTWGVLIENTPSGNLSADLTGWMKSWRFLNGDVEFDQEHALAYTKALYRGDPRNAQVAVNHVHAMTTLRADLSDRLAGTKTPLFVLHGEKDPLVPLSHGQALQRIVPEAQISVLNSAGHMFFQWARLEEYCCSTNGVYRGALSSSFRRIFS